MTPLERWKQINAIIADINGILLSNGVNEKLSPHDITVTDKSVSDLVKENPKLSNAITNSLWPSVGSVTVFHYTSRKAAESILNTGIFHLSSIENRYSEGEIVTFCQTHKLQGYLESDADGMPIYRNLLMKNTFYASFTGIAQTPEQEQYFWRTFAANDGVRLKIEVKALNTNFRKMFYEKIEGKPIRLLSELSQYIQEKYNRHFTLKGISHLCSFYLSRRDYGIENEYRALHRVWMEKDVPSYLEVPLNVMSEYGYQFIVKEVNAFEKPSIPGSFFFTKRSS